MAGTFTDPFAGMTKKADWPNEVAPLLTHVARARTRPKPAGTLGRIHDPSARACTLRLSTLTTQFSFSPTDVGEPICPNAAPAARTGSTIFTPSCQYRRLPNEDAAPGHIVW